MRNVDSYRIRRINEALKEIIGTALSRDLKDPRIGFVTLTGVETAPDLSHARVFISVYGKQREKDATLEGLRAARPYLQRLINDELDLKRTPVLEFHYDDTVDRGMRMQALLRSSGVSLSPEDEPTDDLDGRSGESPEDVSGPKEGERP